MSPRRLISTATRGAGLVAAHQVDRADRGGVLAADQGQAGGERRRVVGEQLLEVLLDAVLLQAGVDAEVVAGVAEDLGEQDPQGVVGLGVGDRPLDLAVLGGALAQRARRRHPVQRLVGAAVGVHQHRAVGLDHQHPGGQREVGGQPPGVVDLARWLRRVSRATNLQWVTDVRPARRDDLDEITAIEGEADQVFVPLFGPLDWRADAGRRPDGPPGFLLSPATPLDGFGTCSSWSGSPTSSSSPYAPRCSGAGSGPRWCGRPWPRRVDGGTPRSRSCTYADVAWNAPFYRRSASRRSPSRPAAPPDARARAADRARPARPEGRDDGSDRLWIV